MLPCRKAVIPIALAAVMATSAVSWARTSVAPKWSTRELADSAEAIVTGRVEGFSSGWDPKNSAIYTYVIVTVDEVFKGAIAPGRLVIKQLGGTAGHTRLRVFDQATFDLGESVLLYLEARPRDGTLYTAGLWQGKWTIEGDLAVRYEPAGHRSAFPVDRQNVGDVRSLSAHLEPRSELHVNTASAEAAAAASPPFDLLGPYRFFFNPPVDVQAEGQSGLPGGGIAEIQSAIAKWNAVGASVQYALGSTSAPARCQTVEVGNGRVTITFNDPCKEISNAGLTLALGGVYSTTEGGAMINGVEFERVLDGFVVNNDGPNAAHYLTHPGCFEDVQLHELGHVLGLDHTSDPDAIMFPSIHISCFSGANQLGVSDRAGLLFVYPPETAGTVPRPPSTAPTEVNVVVNGTTSIIVSFHAVAEVAAAASAAAGYRLDFREALAGPILTTLTTATTAILIPLPPGTAGTFNVTVTPVNGAGAGPSSYPVSFTIGDVPATGCTVPAPPVVTGSLIDGTATVSWAPVPGATFYLLSTGSSPGGTNLFPTTNVGVHTSAEASGLPPGFAAWVRVVAGNNCGRSAPSDFFVSG